MSQTITVRVTTKASRNAIESWAEDARGERYLKVKLTAAPEDGKANKALLKLLAKEWGCAPSALEIVSGAQSRVKKIRRSDD